MKRPLQTLLSLLLLAVALASGFGVYRGWFQAQPSESREMIAPSQTAIPKTRPLFSLPDAQGKLRSIAEWDGQSLTINFWATWCEPCRREIPLLKTLKTQVIGIAIDRREAVQSYIQTSGIEYPVLVGEQEALEVAEKFGVEEIGLPFTVFTDRQGRIVTLRLGELKEREAKAILDTVAAIDRGVLPFDQAKSAIRQALTW